MKIEMEKMKPAPARPGDGADRTLDVLHFERDSLRAIFAPKSVAVIGATEKEGRVGRTVLWNLISNPFGGTVYPINKRHNRVLGIKAYANVAGVPEPIDLAVIVTPARRSPAWSPMRRGRSEKRDHHFGRIQGGGRGVELDARSPTARGKLRLIGQLPRRDAPRTPECNLCERDGAPGTSLHQPGGALLTAVLDWVSAGTSASVPTFRSARLDVDWGDLINYLGDDPHTHSIMIYMGPSATRARSSPPRARSRWPRPS